jgi:YD repeat-containing protein
LTTADPLGHVSTTLYDTMGRLTVTVDALGDTTTLYTSDGRLSTQTDPLGHVSQPTYDADSRRSEAA